MTADLFSDMAAQDATPQPQSLCPGAVLLRGLALPVQHDMLADLDRVMTDAPLRHMITSRGFRMSVAMTNCGQLGWVSDRRGYRYDSSDPLSGRPWPAMPESLLRLARRAAAAAGHADFLPDACLINRYQPGARMALHQDRDERDLGQPIVSVSLGLPAVFQFGGMLRSDKPLRVPLQHGDVVVWGGPARLNFHGVLALKDGVHELLGAQRINLTFRRAG